MATRPASNLPATTASAIPTLGLSLPDKALALLTSGESPVVGPKTAAELRAFSAEPEPPQADKNQVEVMIAKLAMATAQAKVSEAEANERIDLYWLALKDIPHCDLRWAFAELVKTATFLPTPAEVRAKAMLPGSRRRYIKSRAHHLAWKHDVEWRPPVETIDPAEVTALLATVNAGAEQ